MQSEGMINSFSDFFPMDHSYRLYGKTIRSNYPLPLPQVSDPNTDIRVIFEGYAPKRFNYSPVPRGLEWINNKDTKELRYYYTDGKELAYRYSHDGKVIRFTHCWPHWKDAQFSLVNAAMAAAHYLQGNYSLHCASLVLNGYSYLFMGASGQGKSTLSAALISEGMSAHCDDIAVPSWPSADPENPDLPLIPAGYPMVKVMPETMEILKLDKINPIQIFSDQGNDEEFWYPADYLPGGFYNESAPLGGIFILDERFNPDSRASSFPDIRQLDTMQATLELMEHIYGRTWMNPPGQPTLEFAAKTARSAPVYQVALPDRLSLLRDSAGYLFKNYIKPVSEIEPAGL